MRRDFLDGLWHESRTLDELDWKSSARSKLVDFEEQLHEAVEAGVNSYSGQKVWTMSNAIAYAFLMGTTIGNIML